ncbi:MAG TPA: RNA polymerase sigma factor [Armatimonadota bacterium]|jgi:RNA polymerase sigma-70 factor (ECF subfamily)
MQPSDDELMFQCRSGNAQAMDLLVSRYYRRVYAFCYRMLHHRESAEDVAQETLLRAYRYSHRYRADGRFSTWLFAIAANLCRTELSKRSRRSECAWEDLGEMQAPGSVEGTAMLRLDGRAVRQALDRLSPDQRIALVLFYFEGMSYQDIAQVCNCALGTVKSRMHHGIAKMRVLLPALASVPEPAVTLGGARS